MKKVLTLLTMIIASSAFQIYAEVKWTDYKKIVSVQVVGTGGFLVGFDSEINPLCTMAGTSRLYIYPEHNNVTTDGAKALLSTALMALSTGMSANIMYDDSSTRCYGQFMLIKK